MRTFSLGLTILFLFPCLLVFLFLTPHQYAQCERLDPDESLDIHGILHKLTKEFSHFIAFSIDSLSPGLSVPSKLISFLHSLIGCFARASLREATLTPVLLF